MLIAWGGGPNHPFFNLSFFHPSFTGKQGGVYEAVLYCFWLPETD